MVSERISPYKHIIESQQFDRSFLDQLFAITSAMKANPHEFNDELRGEHRFGRQVAMLFYESSTRTRFSFEIAVMNLGGRNATTESAKLFSSASKGESLEHTVRIISGYLKNNGFIVLRHGDDDAAERAAANSYVPIINAGCGQGQHPTQALLDVFTIDEQFNTLEGLDIALVGDLRRGRTVNSLVYLLSKFPNNNFHFVSYDNSRVKPGITDHLKERGLHFVETDNLDEVLPKVHVVYMTRNQDERADPGQPTKRGTGDLYIDKRRLGMMRNDAILMHPLPISDLKEIRPEVDPGLHEKNPKARYFQQAENGIYVRMALLKLLNDHWYKYNRK